MKLSEAIKLHVGSTRSELTGRNYSIYLKKFCNFIGDVDVESIKIIDITKFEVYHNTISTKKQTESVLMCLRSFFKYFRLRYEFNVIDSDRIVVDKQPKGHWKNLSMEQLKKLFALFDTTKINDMRNLCICHVFYSTGLRDFELRQLKRSIIDWDRGEATIIGKGGKQGTIFFTKECLAILKRYLSMRTDDHDALFVDHRRDNGKPISGSLVRTYMTRWSKQLGFKVHAHMLRKTFCTELYRRSNDIYKVKKLARHSSINTTETYAIVEDQDLKEFHNKYMGETHEFCISEKSAGNIVYEIKGFCSDRGKMAKLKKAIKVAADEILS